MACQQKVINANPSAPYFANAYQENFNQANWDGYGNPFQCVELIDRYDWLRWHDTDANGNKWVWGNAAENWNRHPTRFAQKVNGGDTAPAAGDILIWNDNDYGHIAVIVDVDESAQTATILEQNFTYAYARTPGKFIWYTAKRALILMWRRMAIRCATPSRARTRRGGRTVRPSPGWTRGQWAGCTHSPVFPVRSRL